jgi:glycosyltransferase involved in cell wall biosynthesis
MIKVSVIIPVYNGEKYIRHAVHCIEKQTYHNIEIIAVNDGSKDRSLLILQDLASSLRKGVSLVIVDQDNGGICSARNTGLDFCSGDFIMFMDQDDLMKKECIEELVKQQQKEDADMVIGGYDLVGEDNRILEKWTLDPKLPWCKYRITAPWSRLYRRELINDNHIRFMQTKISEDFYFNLVYMSYCGKIDVIEHRGYGWKYRQESESHANMSKIAEDRNPLLMLTQLLKDMKQPNFLEKDLVEYDILKQVIWYMFFVAKGADLEDLTRIYHECFVWLETFLPDYKKNKKISLFQPRGESVKVRAVIWMAMLLKKLNLLLPALKLYSKL